MKIEKARELGLCFGVRRAVKMLREAVVKYGQIETLGPVAHNQQLVEDLAAAGVAPVPDLAHVRGKVVAIPTHGVTPEQRAEIAARGHVVIDTTCPTVRKAQDTAKELAEAGADVIVFGEAAHSEAKGLLGYAQGKGVVALDVADINLSVLSSCIGVISQTTQTWPAFIEFSRRFLMAASQELTLANGERRRQGKQGFGEIRIVNTLCHTTQRRQEAAIEIAGRSELMIVIGGHNSANTRRLAEICASILETHHVERASEVDEGWFVGKSRIGITAGASTPDEAIAEVVAKLESLQLATG